MEKLSIDQQVELVETLQMKWLQRMDFMFDNGTITATDMATLMRFLMANGWALDPAKLPQKLRAKLLDAEELEEAFDELPVRLVR